MAMALWRSSGKRVFSLVSCRLMSSGPGSGAGKGGGTGGSIRDAGGSFGKMEQAHEEQYFRKMQVELLQNIKREHQEQCLYHDDEMTFHQEAINRHTEAIERHRVLKSQHEATLRQQEGEEKQQLYNERNDKKK